MLRKLHSLPGLIAALVLMVTAISGAMLSLNPVIERAGVVQVSQHSLDAATLAARVKAHYPGLEKIVRKPSGAVIAYYSSGGESGAASIDPVTGDGIEPYTPSTTMRWLTNLHRKLLIGDAGRVATGLGAGLMLLLAASGLALLERRMGGWAKLFGRIRGSGLQRIHNEVARVAILGLTLSAATGLVLSLTTFEVIPERATAQLPFPASVSTGAPLAVNRVAALRNVDVTDLRELMLPSPQNPGDVYALRTSSGTGYIDPSSGKWLAWQPNDAWQRFHEVVFMLHTGEGLWWLALILGLASASVPVLAITGVWLWVRRRRATVKVPDNVSAGQADTVILVGSEGNSTWAFAAAIHQALTRANFRVHIAPMNDLSSRHCKAQRLIVLTSTYGDGEAPSSATQYLSKLASMNDYVPPTFAVLGFGDRQFPHFCGYAQTVHDALIAKGGQALIECSSVDRQSESTFRTWSERLGIALDMQLDVRYQPSLPRTVSLTLVERKDYGLDSGSVTSVLRFVRSTPRNRRWHTPLQRALPSFDAGDLLGVIPPGDTVPRFYSLASASRDGFIEICVRRHAHGACSGYLTALQPGNAIQAFIRRNPAFRPAAGEAPIILIGAGTGISPFVGFIRQNSAGRPMHLYFGARRSGEAFLYDEELQNLVGNRRLTTFKTAFSCPVRKTYVQERLMADAPTLRELVASGAQIMVCGGRDMANGVARAWEHILDGSGLSVNEMRLKGRYVEDVY
jgi:sulfite reductase (NADPH) flavoprotein alpha-component